ncbi:MAG: S9 family peptidase, partial [Chloroflexota bacterium]
MNVEQVSATITHPASLIDRSRPAGDAPTLDQIVDQATITQVALAPDGTAAAYVLGSGSNAEKHLTARIYLIDLPDGAARPFTQGDGYDGSPAWSPDGQILAFVSDRHERGTAALYLIRRSGGEARRIGPTDGEVCGPRWSPGGESIAFLLVEPPPKEAEGIREGSAALHPPSAYRPQTLWCIGAAGAGAAPVSAAGDHVWAFAWSPDGTRIAAITASTAEANTLYGEARLVLYEIAEDGARAAAQEVGPAAIGIHEPLLVWSRDGRTLFTLGAPPERFPETYLQAYDARPGAGVPRDLLGALQGTLGWIGRPAESDQLIGLVHQGVRSSVARITKDGQVGEPFGLGPGLDVIHGISASRDGQVLALTGGNAGRLPDLWLWSADSEPRCLTDVNPWLQSRTLGRQQRVGWTSPDGQEIEGLLVLPLGERPEAGYPLVVQIHGGPMGQWFDSCQLNWHDWAQRLAGHALAVLLPNPRGSSGRGNAFVHANVGDIGGGDLQDVLAGVDRLIADGLADPARIGIGGWSYGGTLTAWAITQTARFRCAVVGAGCCDWVSWTGASDIRRFGHLMFDRDMALDGGAHWERSAIRHIG